MVTVVALVLDKDVSRHRYVIAIQSNPVLTMAWSIISKDIDNKTKLDALRLVNDCNKYKMDLCINASIVNEALKFVTQKQEQMKTLQKPDERIQQQRQQELTEEEKTTEGVF